MNFLMGSRLLGLLKPLAGAESENIKQRGDKKILALNTLSPTGGGCDMSCSEKEDKPYFPHAGNKLTKESTQRGPANFGLPLMFLF